MIKARNTLPHVIAVLLCAIAWDAVAQTPEIIVEIEKQEIYEGESVLYRVTLNHVENPSTPILEGFDQFEVTSLGEQSLDSRQITIINGVTSETVRRGRQFNYRLTPLDNGKLLIPAPSAKIGSDVLKGREIELRVNPPDVQDTVLLELSTDKAFVFPMQPFELTLTIAVKELPDELNDRDPLTVQPDPPALSVPWLDDDRIPDGIEVEKSWREILEPLISRRGKGVQVNNIGNSSVFSLFDNEATGFHPDPKRTTRKDSTGADVGYWEYQFRRKLIPQQTGVYVFGPVTLKGTFGSGIDDGKLIGQRLYATSKSLSVKVRDVPIEGRPDSYIGAVGTFDVKAELAPSTARVGDPMTLTLMLSGQGTLANARPPEIASMPGVKDAFRTYDATEETQGNSRRFTYSIRALSTDVKEFPSIPVSFFDVKSAKYSTIRTDPISVTISEAKELSTSEILSAPNATDKSRGDLVASESGIFANDSNVTSIRNETIHPARWLMAWAGMIGFYSIVSLGIGRVRRLRGDATLQRRRTAVSRATTALQEARTLIENNALAAACDSMRRAIMGLIADFANVTEAGLTPRDASERLEALGVDDALRDRSLLVLNHCDAARYGAGFDDAVRLCEDAHEVIEALIATLRKTGK